MIQALFGQGSVYATLRSGLDEEMTAAGQIQDRIANAANAETMDSQAPLTAANREEEVNLEGELVKLVDTTLRYDAETRLLREAYSRLRTAIGGGRG